MEPDNDTVSENVIFGFALILGLLAVILLVTGYALVGLVVAFAASAIGGGTWMRVRYWPSRPRRVQRRAQTVGLTLQLFVLGAEGLWDLAGGGRNHGVGFALLVLVGLMSAVLVRERHPQRARQ